MADIAAPSAASLATLNPPNECQWGGLIAGEALNEASLCYVKLSDGKVYMSDGGVADAEAKVDGMCLEARSAGDPVTLFFDVDVAIVTSTTLTGLAGTRLFLSATEGLFADAASTGGTGVIGLIKSPTKKIIRVLQSRY